MAAKNNRPQGKRKRRPNTEQLTRIIIYLEEIGKAVNMQTIQRDTLINNVYLKHALTWLVRHGLIRKKREGVWLYYKMKGGRVSNEN